jgi:predicted Zn-dependent peptidase
VPVLSLDVPGPLCAELIFRVGVVDERLPSRGITHLVEHVAMSRLIQSFAARGRTNAQVDPWHTRFAVTGNADEVADFLAAISESLCRLPSERLDNERQVLRTEAANTTVGSVKSIWSWRFGPTGIGLVDYEEFGLRWLDADHVAHWAAANFTAENAILWVSGPVPENVRLELPRGERKPLPDPRPLPWTTPAMYQQGDRWVAMSMLGARTAGLLCGAQILDGRLRERLRHDQPLAYEANARYQPIGRLTAEVTCFADSLGPNSARAADALVEVVRRLAEDGPTREEIAAVVAESKRAREHPAAGLGLLNSLATQELDGVETKSLDELDSDAENLTPGAVASALRKALPSAFLGVPEKVPTALAGFTPIPKSAGSPVRGFEVRPMPGAGHADLIHFSSDGISITFPNRTTIGIRWDEVLAALWWSDGRRTLLGPHGSSIRIFPAKWQNVQPLLDAIRTNVPPDRWVPMEEPRSLPRV